jgi:hypothetical protein
MLDCSILDNSDEIGSSEGVEDANKPHTTAHLIEKIVKQHKSHRSASDFDTGFINRIIQAMKNNQHDKPQRMMRKLIDSNDNRTCICSFPCSSLVGRISPTGGISAGAVERHAAWYNRKIEVKDPKAQNIC